MPVTFGYDMPLCIVFSVKPSQANQTELACNFTEAGFKVHTKLHIAYREHA